VKSVCGIIVKLKPFAESCYRFDFIILLRIINNHVATQVNICTTLNC